MSGKRLISVLECGVSIDFPFVKCKHHVCREPRGHALDAEGEARKHACECGVKWTHDPEVAGIQQVNTQWADAGEIPNPFQDSFNRPPNDKKHN